MNNWTTWSVFIQCPPFIDSQDISRTHGRTGASGNKKFPGAMLPLFDQNLQTSCLNFLSRSSPLPPWGDPVTSKWCSFVWNSDFHTCARFQSLNSSAIAIASQFALNRPKTDLLGAFIHSQARMREALKRANVKVNKFPSSLLSLFFWRK